MSRCQEGASPRIMAQGSFDHKRVTCGILVSLSPQAMTDSSWLCLTKGTYASGLEPETALLVQGSHPLILPCPPPDLPFVPAPCPDYQRPQEALPQLGTSLF